MLGLGSIPGLGPAAAGLLLLADAVAARFLLRADETQVWILGRPIPWTCDFRTSLGLPCPTCGITRSLVLSLHGELSRAWQVAPAGPVVIAGLVALAIGLLVLAAAQQMGFAGPDRRARSWVQYGVLTYACAASALWIGGWVASLTAALKGP